jgi:hypothetical protein
MHESGQYPGQYPSNDAEITNLLSEMHDCLVTCAARLNCNNFVRLTR